MAVYEEQDINAELINEKFPSVASAIIAGAPKLEMPEIDAAFIKDNHPDIAESFVAEGKEAGMADGKVEGAKAEAGRVAEIEAVAMPGYENIVADAKADGTSTAEDVELAIIRKQRESLSNGKAARSTDGANLAAQTAELNAGASGEANELSEEDKAVALMDEAAKNAKGA